MGIDFGSTATRVVVSGQETNQGSNERIISDFYYQIQDSRADDGIDKRFEEGEYPSVGCPYDGRDVIVGYDAANQTGKRPVSLKSAVYFLSDDTDNHPFTEALCDYYSSLPSSKEKEFFREHLESMLLRFLYRLPIPTACILISKSYIKVHMEYVLTSNLKQYQDHERHLYQS